MRKKIFLALKIFVSVFLLVFLFKQADTNKVLEIMRSMDITLFLFAISLYALSQIVSAFRWSLFLPHADIHLPFLKLVSLYYIGMFFNMFLPTIIGGDVVKSYYLYKFSGKGGNSIASVFLDRFTGFSALVTIAFVSIIIGYRYVKDTSIPLLVITLTGAFLLTSLIIWNRSLHKWALVLIDKIRLLGINEKFESLYNAVMLYKGEPQVLLKAFLISFVVQIKGVVIFYLISRGFGLNVSIGYFFMFVPIAVSISMIPISLSGLGLREGAFVYLFSKVGMTSAQALSISLAGFAIMVLLGLVGGVEYIRLGSVKDTVKSQGSRVRSQENSH